MLVRLASRIKKKIKRQSKHTGWQPKLDDQGHPSGYQSLLERELRGIPLRDVEKVTLTIVNAASEHAKGVEIPAGPKRSEEGQSLFDERRVDDCPEKRKEL